MGKYPLVVIDPGHGGSDPGAVAPDGTRESDLNLSLAHAVLAAAPGFDFHPLLTRDDDSHDSLEERARISNERGAAAFISLHCNAAADPAAHGFEVWTSPGQTDADALATAIYGAMLNHWPLPGRADLDDGDPDREARFYVLRKTAAPAVLVEFGFMSNRGDLEELREPTRQFYIALAIVAAVNRWLAERRG